jgi:hypothetical protein
LKEASEAIVCSASNCALTECCNKDKPICIPSDNEVLTTMIDDDGCMCNEMTNQMCAEGSHCWTDNTCHNQRREAQLYVVEFETILSGIDPEDFNANTDLILAFKATVAQMLDGVSLEDVYDVVATLAKTRRMRHRRQLLAATEATVSYKVRTESKDQAKKAQEKVSKNNNEFTTLLRAEVAKKNIKGVAAGDLKATTSDNVAVTEESKVNVLKQIKSAKDGNLNDEAIGNNDRSINNDGSPKDKEEKEEKESNVWKVFVSLFSFLLLIYGWYKFKTCGRDIDHNNGKRNAKDAENSMNEQEDLHDTFSNMFSNPSLGFKPHHIELTDFHTVNDVEIELPKLHLLLNDLKLRSFLNKMILYGVHTTKILLEEVNEQDLIKIGFRTRQRRVLESKMNELRMQSGISTKVIQHHETKQEKTANSEPSQKCWKRRFR